MCMNKAILQCLNERKGTATALNQSKLHQHMLHAVAFNVGRLNTVWFILACATCVVNSVVSCILFVTSLLSLVTSLLLKPVHRASTAVYVNIKQQNSRYNKWAISTEQHIVTHS
jgi:hypothetical protein